MRIRRDEFSRVKDLKFAEGKKAIVSDNQVIMSVIPTLGQGGAEAIASELAIGFARRGLRSSVHVLSQVRGDRGLYLKTQLERNGVPVRCPEVKSPKYIASVAPALLNSMDSFSPRAMLAHLPASELYVALTALQHPSLTRARVLHIPKVSRLQRALNPFFRASIAVSSETLKIAAQNSMRSLSYVPNGILSPPAIIAARTATDLPIRLFMVGHFRGGLHGQKGLDIALQALKAIASTRPVEFHVAGVPQSEAALLRQYSQSLDVEALVVNHKVVSSVPKLIEQVRPHLCLLPSRQEGESIALMEYSMMGMPIVLSEIESFRSQFESSFDWTFFASGDAASLAQKVLQRIAKKSGADSTYFLRAQQKFSLERTIDMYLDILGS